MRNVFVMTTALAVVAFAELAQANTVNGELWESNTGALDATIGSVPSTTPDVTFTAPSPLNFSTNSTDNTVGAFLTSGGASVLSGGGTLGTPLSNGVNGSGGVGTLVNFYGTVTLTNGETFNVEHDDGLTLQIGGTLNSAGVMSGGTTLINAPLPTSPTSTPVTFNGTTGNYTFELVYGECCGPPAVLEVNLPLEGVPGPTAGAGLPGLLAMFGFAGFRYWKRRQQPAAAAA